jgi:hypothetical protein
MLKIERRNGKTIRKIAKLDRAWRLAGKVEGRTENDLAMWLGRAARVSRDMGNKGRRAQVASAARLGQLSGWEGRIGAC